MKTLIVDRFEGGFAICEEENKGMFGIEIGEMPKGAKEGDVIVIDDEGVISIDAAETQKRRERISKKTKNLFS